MKNISTKRTLGSPLRITIAAMIGAVMVTVGFGQESLAANKGNIAAVTAPQVQQVPPQPLVSELKGIAIGMHADEVKTKLGKPKLSDATSLYYMFSDGESLQIALDDKEQVKMAAMIYLGNEADAPEFLEVFGPAVAQPALTDGRLHKLVRYPEAGYWVAYGYLTVEDEPMTTVTIQKIS
jgi:hypothetical protein